MKSIPDGEMSVMQAAVSCGHNQVSMKATSLSVELLYRTMSRYRPVTNLVLIRLDNGTNINFQTVITASLVLHILLYVNLWKQLVIRTL